MKAELVPENGDPPIPIVRDVTLLGRHEDCDVVIEPSESVEAALLAGEDRRAAGDPRSGDDERHEGQGAAGAVGGPLARRSRELRRVQDADLSRLGRDAVAVGAAAGPNGVGGAPRAVADRTGRARVVSVLGEDRAESPFAAAAPGAAGFSRAVA